MDEIEKKFNAEFRSKYLRTYAGLLNEIKAKLPQDPNNPRAVSYYTGIIDGEDQFKLEPDDTDFEYELLIHKNKIISNRGTLNEWYWSGFCKIYEFNLTQYESYKKQITQNTLTDSG
jgi:hypothetical protein